MVVMATTLERPAWHSLAACAWHPDLMYPEVKRGVRINWRPAAKLCAQCPIIDKCIQESDELETGAYVTIGFRAGQTPTQRNMRRGRGRTAVIRPRPAIAVAASA
jgi:hypothetical protein